ncbi:unnamed protein product [Symbiodinium sp. KB8]|nr:unnamed protein product [Symbiodinium sp. KB8]
MRASPLFASAMPVPRKAEGCSFDEKYGAEGTLFHLECSHMHVRCTVPCVAGRHIWALRIGNWVRAACATRLSWDEVLEVAGLSYWDLPGTSIHGPDQVWSWPEDVVSLSGHCGHVMHSGSDPYLECIYSADTRPTPTPVDRSHGHRPALSLWQLPILVLATRGNALHGHVGLLLALTTAKAVSDTNASDTPSALHSSSESEGLAVMTDTTPSCSSAWCHELSCQSTHFTVNSASLAEYFSAHSPTELVRVQLWNPFEGPSLFDFLRTESATVLHSKSLAAGHDPSRRVLYVAFDTQSTVVDLVSVPPHSGDVEPPISSFDLATVHLPLPLDVPCILRDGDVLDAVSPGGERSDFQANHPGRWVPVPWVTPFDITQGTSEHSRGRWVPANYLPEHDVSFVEQPDPLAVHVLLMQPYDPTATACRRLLLDSSAERSDANRVSEEWQLRPDIQNRVVLPWPRNGDVMVPRIRRNAFSTAIFPVSSTVSSCGRWPGSQGLFGLTAFVFASLGSTALGTQLPQTVTRDGLLTWVLLAAVLCRSRVFGWFLLAHAALAMVVPPVEQQHLAPVPVGKFPWRVPSLQRLCGESVLPESRARLLSPFCGDGDVVEVCPETPVEEVRISLSGAEPYWFCEIVPVWPSIWPHTTVYVPLPTGGDLVCVVVASPEWQLAVLMPRRADQEWLLAYLRRITPGPIFSLHPPLAARPTEVSPRGALDWRTGDLLLAFQCGSSGSTYELPVFVSPQHVRHAAIWNYGFIVQCNLPLLIWRVGRRPSETVMPPPVRWVALEQTFTLQVAMCQCAEASDHCNIIFETCQDGHLRGECITVSTSSSRYSLSQLTGASPDGLYLLGHGVDSVELPRLRDGDTIFHDTAPVTDRARHRAPGSVLLALLCWTSRRGCPFAFASLWWTMSSTWVFPSRDDQASRGPPPDEVRCKAHRGSSVTDTVPAGSFWSMLYWSLAQLGAYLPAYGSPVWERQDQEWVSNLDDVCALQARLHSVWWSRPLRDGLPTLFPSTYHAAWGSHPLWAGGVPDSLLISTDGSGLRGGSWAFVVWACYRSSWYRVGWDGMDLSATPWCHAGGHTPIRQQSYISELTALQAAAIWCLTAVDRWQLWMSASPKLVSVVVDNAAALQVAAGHGAAAQQAAQHTRVLWQAVQSRVNTSFRHVHSHVGVMANTIVDALAGLHLSCPLALRELLPPATRMEAQLTELGPYLWLVPRARMMDGSPFLRFSAVVQKSQSDLGYRPDRDSGHCESADPEDVVPASPDVPSSVRRQPISLNILTANVQTMKDAKPSIFNPSGHAARRQYLLQQVGHWWLAFLEIRSFEGSVQLQGVGEAWHRESPANALILAYLGFYAPYHDGHLHRWPFALDYLFRACPACRQASPSYRGVVLGVDANADFFAPDEDGQLIGSLLAAGEPGRNDMHLLELCLHRRLVAPSTQAEVQDFTFRLPRKAPFTARQPYLASRTVVALADLRASFNAWSSGHARILDVAARRDSCRLHAAMSGQEARLSRKVHDLARRDKARHFLQLTKAATDLWHLDGRPMEALTKLRWASRKAAEKRAAFAAGGYDIDAQLEEQFRSQEGGRLITSSQVEREYREWAGRAAPTCSSALPTLIELEHLCRRQQASKAPGSDLILNELWRSFPAYAGRWFWQVCTQIALAGHEPLHFKLALICRDLAMASQMLYLVRFSRLRYGTSNGSAPQKVGHLGVVQNSRDTGRRDNELSARRACSAWAHGRNLLASTRLPWALETSWLSGRVLPAAYATLATSVAVSARAWSPLTGFYERAARTLVGSWQFGHFLTGPMLGGVLGLVTPEHAAIIARVRLVVQLVVGAPAALFDLFDAAWNRATPWCDLLADGLRTVSVGLHNRTPFPVTSLAFVRQDVVVPRQKAVLGAAAPLAAEYAPPGSSLLNFYVSQAPARVDLIDAPSAAMPVGVPPPSSTPRPLRWFSLVDYSRVAASDWHTPSPRWDGILQSPFVIQLPSTWHRFCRVWLAMQSVPAWSGQAFRAARVLRDVSVVDPGIDPVAAGASPPPLLLDFLAATVSLRQVCSALHSHGCAWISGIPSPTGQSLLRSLLPDTTFHVVRSESTTAFVAAHVTSSPSVWRRELSWGGGGASVEKFTQGPNSSAIFRSCRAGREGGGLHAKSGYQQEVGSSVLFEHCSAHRALAVEKVDELTSQIRMRCVKMHEAPWELRWAKNAGVMDHLESYW